MLNSIAPKALPLRHRKSLRIAETVEAIATEVVEYGLLQTRHEKLEFAKRSEKMVLDATVLGYDNAQSFPQRFLVYLKWSKSKDRTFFEKEETVGFTRSRFVKDLISSPKLIESAASLGALFNASKIDDRSALEEVKRATKTFERARDQEADRSTKS